MTAGTSTGLLVRSNGSPDAEGRLVTVTPESAGWRHVGFQSFRLRAGQRVQRQTLGEEACVVLLGGRCRARAGGQDWPEVGGRATPFDGPPHALYLPVGTEYELEALADNVEFAIGTGPVARPSEARIPRLITPDEVRVSTRGAGAMERTIHDILMEDQAAETLLVTEVVTPGGHWSSYPPHKHDTHDPPRETYLEELYYHRMRQADGWAVQRVYVRDGTLDVTVAVRDGDCVLVPRGYHPVSAAPGFDLYYLNVMAGPVRQWRVTLDADVERALHVRAQQRPS
ncbi:MAG: 5-deoxy-glucuronate isomerase [Chloroflexi bacterium]|nr:5-deoxy-glucuronate isomerase [Chloroflexota bacterium]